MISAGGPWAKVNSNWCAPRRLYAKVSGTWLHVAEAYVKQNGVWHKQRYKSRSISSSFWQIASQDFRPPNWVAGWHIWAGTIIPSGTNAGRMVLLAGSGSIMPTNALYPTPSTSTGRGIYYSDDSGNNYPPASFVRVNTNKNMPFAGAGMDCGENGVLCMAFSQPGAGTGFIWRSTNGGASWTQVLNASDWAPFDVKTDGDGTWIACGGATSATTRNARVFRSTNDGVSWTQILNINPPGAATNQRCFHHLAYDEALNEWWVFPARKGVSGDPLHVMKSTNGGLNWTEVPGIFQAPSFGNWHGGVKEPIVENGLKIIWSAKSISSSPFTNRHRAGHNYIAASDEDVRYNSTNPGVGSSYLPWSALKLSPGIFLHNGLVFAGVESFPAFGTGQVSQFSSYGTRSQWGPTSNFPQGTWSPGPWVSVPRISSRLAEPSGTVEAYTFTTPHTNTGELDPKMLKGTIMISTIMA